MLNSRTDASYLIKKSIKSLYAEKKFSSCLFTSGKSLVLSGELGGEDADSDVPVALE